VAACKLDAVCRRAFPDPMSQLDAVLQRLQREPASVAWKHPKTGAAIQIRIDRRMFSEIIWMILMGREAWNLPFIIARGDSRDFTPLLEHGFMIGWLPMQASITAMYLSVTCPRRHCELTLPTSDPIRRISWDLIA
jgi:hypothetical protein